MSIAVASTAAVISDTLNKRLCMVYFLFLNKDLFIGLESKLDVTENGTNGCCGNVHCIHAAVSSV